MSARRAGSRGIARYADRRVVLLSGVQPVREVVVDVDLIELGGRLVILCRPRPAAVQGHVGAAVVGLDLDAGILRVDPEVVVVAVGGRAAREAPSTVVRLVETLVVDVDVVRIGRVGGDSRVIERPVHEATLVADQLPRLTEVVGAIKPLVRVGRLDQRIDTVGRVRGDREVDLSDQAGRKALGHDPPAVTAVRRLPDAVLPGRSLHSRDDRPGLALATPHRCVDLVRVSRVQLQVDRADGVGGEEHLIPRPTAVTCPVHSALGALGPRVPQSRRVGDVRVRRMDLDGGDLTHLHQADTHPGRPGIIGAIHAAPHDHVRPDPIRAGAHVYDLGVGRCDPDRPDRPGLEVTVGDRTPGCPVVLRLPHTPTRGAQVERERVVRMSGNRGDTPAPRRPDVPVAEGLEDLLHGRSHFRSHLLSGRLLRERDRIQQGGEREHTRNGLGPAP